MPSFAVRNHDVERRWGPVTTATSKLRWFTVLKRNITDRQWFGWHKPADDLSLYDAVQIQCEHCYFRGCHFPGNPGLTFKRRSFVMVGYNM